MFLDGSIIEKLWRPALRPRKFESPKETSSFPPSPLLLTLYYLGENYKGAWTDNRRRKIYPEA